MKKSTITYRLNQNEFQKIPSEHAENVIALEKDEYEVVNDSQPLNPFTTDFGGWSSPFDIEVEKLEKMIRDAGDKNADELSSNEAGVRHETNHHEESGREFDPVTGYYSYPNDDSGGPVYGQDDRIYTARYLRHRRTPWLKMISSVAGAVLTGILFGLFILSMFSDEHSTIPATEGPDANTYPGVINENEQTDPLTNDSTQDVTQTSMIQVNLPAQSFFILQNGVFRNEEGANEAHKNLVNKGFSAASEHADGYYVFAGISLNRDDALFMSHQLQQHDFETYIKTYTIPAVQHIYWKDQQSEQVETYFSEGNRLVKMICNLTNLYLQKPSPEPIENSSLEAVMTAHQHWNGLASQIDQGIPDELASQFQKLNNSLTTAVQSLTAYHKNPSYSYLWQSQTGIMEYVLLQKLLLNQLSGKDTLVDIVPMDGILWT